MPTSFKNMECVLVFIYYGMADEIRRHV